MKRVELAPIRMLLVIRLPVLLQSFSLHRSHEHIRKRPSAFHNVRFNCWMCLFYPTQERRCGGEAGARRRSCDRWLARDAGSEVDLLAGAALCFVASDQMENRG